MINIGWYDIKTRFKSFIRGIFYYYPIQQLVCYFIIIYMLIVYYTSKKKYIGLENYKEDVMQSKPLIMAFWHNRLFLCPFFAVRLRKKVNKNYKFLTLASKHGDGRFVGEVLSKFGLRNIYGSTKNNNKAGRGIEFKSIRTIVKQVKSGKCLGITPDGPRGPNQQINGEILNIAKLTKAKIMPVSYSASRFIEVNSWDKFKIPLPFSKIYFVAYENNIKGEDIDDNYNEDLLKDRLKKYMDHAQEKSESYIK